MIPKLVILTEIIAPYRIPVFNALAQRPELNLHVIFLSENDPTLRQWRVYKDEIRFQYDVLPSWRRRLGGYNVLLNRGVHAALNRIEPDVLLCGGYNYLASRIKTISSDMQIFVDEFVTRVAESYGVQ